VTASRLQHAFELHQAGQLAQAQSIYEDMLTEQPARADVVNLLGAIALQTGEVQKAVDLYSRAIEIDPANVAAWCNSALAHAQLGQLSEALCRYDRAVVLRGDVAETHFNRGQILHRLGQLAAALRSYQRAIELEPDYAEAHLSSGDVLREQQEYEAALKSYERAIATVPDYDEAYCQRGIALVELGQLEAALGCFDQAIALKADYAEAYCNRGNVLTELGRLQEALASFQYALKLKPNLVEGHNGLGNALRALERSETAVASYQRALELKPDYADAHLNLGSTLLDLIRFDAAATSYRRALECKPNYAEAHHGLSIALRLLHRANEAQEHCRRALEINPTSATAIALEAGLCADQGQFAEAETLYRRALSIAPDLTEAWAGIAGVRRMTASDADWQTDVQRMVAKVQAPRQKAILCYALGKYFDDVRDFEQAFLHYQRANELSKSYIPIYDAEAAAATTDVLIRSYDHRWVEGARLRSSTSARPVFVIGMPRSGTSLAEQILASHPAVFGAGEPEFWHAALRAHQSSERTLEELAGDYLELLTDLSGRDALRVIDKMPSNFRSLGLIHAALPGARIIHMMRQPIDTCLSIYFQNFAASYGYANDLQNLRHFYGEYRRLMVHWHAVLPAGSILDVPYEGLVDDPDTWSRRMLEFIGLRWDPNCLKFYQTQRTVITASSWQVRQKISKSSVARWRNYEQFIGPLSSLVSV
jgi:tetratricopeptide (TPR) repeat protein